MYGHRYTARRDTASCRGWNLPLIAICLMAIAVPAPDASATVIAGPIINPDNNHMVQADDKGR